MFKKTNYLVIFTGVLIGLASLLLTKLGNPANMGFCIACFLRDIAGALKLHSTETVQYIRPEILGIVLGSTLISFIKKEFRPHSGSSPALRFILGMFVMIGALAFLGCPLRMVIRMGGGDVNAFVGLIGFTLGILIGIFFLKRSFSLKRNYEALRSEASVFPVVCIALFIIVMTVPTILAFSLKGPGSKHAPFIIAFMISLLVGVFAQRSRICMVGGMRDAFMFRDFTLLSGFAIIFVTVILGNIVLGNFSGFSTYLQPISHESQIWNLLGMVIVGWSSVLLGGCPLRQLVLAGEGNGDSAVTVFGMVAGAAISHNFKLAGVASSMKNSVYSVGDVSLNGQIVLMIIVVTLLFISFASSSRRTN